MAQNPYTIIRDLFPLSVPLGATVHGIHFVHIGQAQTPPPPPPPPPILGTITPPACSKFQILISCPNSFQTATCVTFSFLSSLFPLHIVGRGLARLTHASLSYIWTSYQEGMHIHVQVRG